MKDWEGKGQGCKDFGIPEFPSFHSLYFPVLSLLPSLYLSFHYQNRKVIALYNNNLFSHNSGSLGKSLILFIATVSIAQDQLEETISTCRFAQRVATISNQV